MLHSNNYKQYKIIDKFSLYYRFDKNSKSDKRDYSIYTANYVGHKYNTKQSANKIKNSRKGLPLVEHV